MKADVQKIYDGAFEGALEKLKTATDEPGELLTLVSQFGDRFNQKAKELQAHAVEDANSFLANHTEQFAEHRRAREALRIGLNPKPRPVETGGVIKAKK